jgi:hypothetical protein
MKYEHWQHGLILIEAAIAIATSIATSPPQRKDETISMSGQAAHTETADPRHQPSVRTGSQ